jgi:ABC-type dipeptide/oligopeptide/nickel transport system permease component
MARYLLRRLVLTVPVLLGVATLVFALIHLVPGDPAQSMLGESAAPDEVARLRTASASTGRC